MKIKEIQISRVPLALTRPYTIAYKSVSDVEICFVEVITDNKLSGLGSANPSPYVVNESMDDCIAALSEEKPGSVYRPGHS